jgi:hypothetical protein
MVLQCLMAPFKRGDSMANKKARSFRLTAVANDLLDQLSDTLGIDNTAVLETLIREGAAKRGLKPSPIKEEPTGPEE